MSTSASPLRRFSSGATIIESSGRLKPDHGSSNELLVRGSQTAKEKSKGRSPPPSAAGSLVKRSLSVKESPFGSSTRPRATKRLSLILEGGVGFVSTSMGNRPSFSIGGAERLSSMWSR